MWIQTGPAFEYCNLYLACEAPNLQTSLCRLPLVTDIFRQFQWLKWFCEAGGGSPDDGWSIPHTHSNPTNLVLFRHKITLYRFNHGGSYYCRGLKWEQGALSPPDFNHLAI